MKIGIVQIYNDKIKDYAQYSTLINSYYALSHNYYYMCWADDLVPLEYSVYYNKILAVYQALKSSCNFDWVLYLDADAIITNFNISIEDIIARHQDKEIIMAADRNGQNNGVILIKNTPAMADYLQECYLEKTYFHTKTPEQLAMFDLIKQPRYADKLGIEPMWFLNAYLGKYKDMQYDEPLWGENSFILHLQQFPDKKRIEIFKQILGEKHLYFFAKD